MDITTKTCSLCKEKRFLDEFNKDSKGKHGRRPDCKYCTRNRDRARKAMPAHPVPKLEDDAERLKRAEATRNSLLILMQRHQEEFEEIYKDQMWRANNLKRDSRKIEVNNAWMMRVT